jgi:diaminopimelate epimerase
MLTFTKMNGAGNDFVLVDNRTGSLNLDTQTIARICDRHRGVGADGLLMVEPAANGADFRMRYYNSDGGEAEMCGNGARCFARYATKIAGAREQVSFETPAGVITAQFIGDLVRLGMSEPKNLRLNDSIEALGSSVKVHSVNTGVPHAVVFVDDLDGVNVQQLGAEIRYHEHFAPKGTNVNFVKLLDANTVAIRTYERGVEGETLACGTGVVAVALITHELNGTPAPVGVRVKGGDLLQVSFAKAASGYSDVTLTGPADFVFDGQIKIQP